MPAMHRVACFRDDLVFCVFVYQRYLYPVDYKRINEFGQAGDVDDKQDTNADGAKAATEDKKTQ